MPIREQRRGLSENMLKGHARPNGRSAPKCYFYVDGVLKNEEQIEYIIIYPKHKRYLHCETFALYLSLSQFFCIYNFYVGNTQFKNSASAAVELL
jgi:hypothetical protein